MPRVQLTPLTDGPYQVTGDPEIVDSDGRPIEPPSTPMITEGATAGV